METPETLCMLVLKLSNGVADTWNRKSLMLRRSKQSGPPLKDFIEFFEEEIILVNDPIFSREAITAYVGTQGKSDDQRKGEAIANSINHHQPEPQYKCILCSHKLDLDSCEEYMTKSIEERSKLLARKKLCYGCYKTMSMSHNARNCSDRRICQICKKKHPTGLHGYTPKQKAGDDKSGASDGTKKIATFKSNCAKFHDVNCSASCSDKMVSICIVSVKIRFVNKKKEVTAYVLLNN